MPRTSQKSRKQAIGRINRYFASLKGKGGARISEIFSREARRLNIKYFNDSGRARDIRLVLRPWLIRPDEMRFFHKLIYAFKAANHKLFRLYLHDKRIREIMPLRNEEREWFGLINRDKLQEYQVVFGRWDTNVSFDDKENIRGIKFLETNTVGIGGIHYIPAVSEAIRKILKIELEGALRPCRLDFQADARCLLAEEIKRHAKLIGRRSLNVAFMENHEYLGGTVELPQLSRYFLKAGIKAVLVDPRDLRLKGTEVYFRDMKIDIIYRDSELQELIDIERKGHNMAVLKQAFMNNQVISSIAGELDHKSGFEIFTNPEFLRFFSREENELFRRYIPWTRLLRERRTTDARLRRIDLVPYVLNNKNRLIIKPNRAYGGKGVVIGKSADKNKWSACIQKALAGRDEYVVQDFVDINEELFPFFDSGKRIAFDKFYSVSGFVVTRRSIAVLGRFSKEIVVNVARKGGIIPALLLR